MTALFLTFLALGVAAVAILIFRLWQLGRDADRDDGRVG